MAKLKVMNSQMGLRPLMAAPTAKPAKPISVIGVSITRFGPNLSSKPLVTYSNNIGWTPNPNFYICFPEFSHHTL